MQLSRLQSCGSKTNTLFKLRQALLGKNNLATSVHTVAAKCPKSFKEISGPRSILIFGPLLNFLPGIGSLRDKVGLELSKQLYRTYGPIVKLAGWLGSPAMTMLYDPEACAQVLRSENLTAVRTGFHSLEYYRKQYKKKLDTNAITGLITDQGAPWKSMRMKVNPVMLHLKTVKLYSTVLDEVAVDMIKRQALPIKNVVVAVHQNATESSKPFKEIPGPWSMPIIGPLLHFLPGIGSIGDKVGMELNEKLYQTYGPIVKLDGMLGRPPMIMLYDPEACAEVLRGENLTAVRSGFHSLEYYRKQYKKKFDPNAITGLITDHGAPWKSMRMKVNPVMLQPKTVKLYSTVLDEVAVDTIKRMKLLRDEKNMIPDKFDVEMNKWALESIAVVALGGRIGALEPDLPEDSPARQLIQCVHDIFEVAQNLDFKPSMWRYFPTKEFKKGMKLYEHQINLSKIFITKAREQLEKKKDTTEEKSILEKLLEIDEHIAIVMAADMLFAGVDTAANTVMATMYLLAENPGKQNKLREEVLSGEEKNPYLKACIKEAMRLLPVVSGNLRQVTKDYTLCGFHIPRDTAIIFNHQYLALMESQFPRANEFIPERWLVPKDDPLYYGNAHPFSMMPFGFGARQCIGKRIAALEMETFVTRLVQNFNIEWIGEPLNVKPTSLNYCKPPFNFVFKDL